jgi:hypothetical protein
MDTSSGGRRERAAARGSARKSPKRGGLGVKNREVAEGYVLVRAPLDELFDESEDEPDFEEPDLDEPDFGESDFDASDLDPDFEESDLASEPDDVASLSNLSDPRPSEP